MRRRMSRSVGTLALLAALAAGCGGGSGHDRTVGGTLPACANESRRAELPEGLPPVPLPPGLVLTDAQRLGGGQFSLRGVVRGGLDGVAGFFERRLPEEGYALGVGDAEAHEQEAPFTGHGFRGRWRVIKNPGDCPVVAVFVVLIQQDS
jgi:hypothetical protein